MKHPDGTTTKTVYIRTKAGQAEDLKQRLTGGKAVALVKKLQNGTVNNNLTPNRSNVTLIKQTVSKHTVHTLVSQTTANVDVDAENQGYGKKNVMKPKAVALKVNPSGVVTPSNSQLLDLVRNYKVQQLEQQQQQRQQHQLQQQRQQQQQSEKQSIQHVQQLQQRSHTHQPPQNKQQATVLQKTITMIPISPDLQYNETKSSQKVSSPQPQLQMSPRSACEITFNNGSPLTNPSVLPKPTNCETGEHNYTLVSHENPAQTVKSVVYPPNSSVSVSPNTNVFRSPAKIHRQPTTRFNFPMSSLLSLNLKNTIVTQLPPNQQLIAVSPKIESPGRSNEVKVSPLLQRKMPPLANYSPITKKNKQTESWSEQDAPLSAVSLQNGLQRVLSMTPFSTFLDEDVGTEKNKKSNARKATSEKTDIVRSHQIVDEQLAKISRKTERADTLPGAETDVQKGQKCGNSKDLREERKTLTTTKELRAVPRREETKKFAANTEKVKMKGNDHFTGTVMDDKDLKEDFNRSDAENDNERLSCGGYSIALEQGDHVKIDESKDTNRTPENVDSFETKLLKDILKRILPEEVISRKSNVHEEDNEATVNAPEKTMHLLGRDSGKFLSPNEATKVTRTRLGRKTMKVTCDSPVSIDKTSKRLEK